MGEQGVDMVFASFIRNADGVKQVKEVLGDKGAHIQIVPKIENQQGVKNLDEIIACSQGLMVARGDMGIEIPTEKVFIAQKAMIAECNRAGKAVICATQMLESMVKNPRPTRAEASDVANAILDGADCVMLSGETAKGDYPIQCIKTMASLSREAEACLWNSRFFEELMRSDQALAGAMDATKTTSVSAVQASYISQAAAIVAITTSGRTDKICAKFRPQCPIIAVTRFPQVARQMQLHRGILPLFYKEDRLEDWTNDVEERIQFGVDFGKRNGFIKSGNLIVCITGWRKGAGS